MNQPDRQRLRTQAMRKLHELEDAIVACSATAEQKAFMQQHLAHLWSSADKAMSAGVDLAQLSHEVIRAYCEAFEDYEQPTWAEASEAKKDRVREGVRGILCGYFDSAERQHAVWLQRKQLDGWVYGPVKDEEAKQHPCCLPYAELPIAQRTKAYLCRAVVLNAARLLGEAKP